MDSTDMLDLHYHELLLYASTALNWNQQHSLLNGGEHIPSLGDEHLIINPSLTSHMVQDLGFHWTNHGHHSAPQQPLHLQKIKHEEQALIHDLNSYSSPHFTNGNSSGFDPLSFGMFLPNTVNLRSSFIPVVETSDQFSRISPFVENMNDGVQHHWQDPAQARRIITLNEMRASVNEGVVHGNKRENDTSMDQVRGTKKTRFESRTCLSPFKVRKEKLGDRIAALQQLVAPFGKTDTASVLMEAIGYIKFLQDQVETLSVPYIGASNNRKLCTTSEASGDEREEPKPDLRTRGLCLVPLSCTSYVTNDDDIAWSPPNFR